MSIMTPLLHQYQDTTSTLAPPPSELAVFTYDYSEEVVWRADTVVVDGTEFSEQGLTKYNGDHDWACHVDILTVGEDVLQTYIRGEKGLIELLKLL